MDWVERLGKVNTYLLLVINARRNVLTKYNTMEFVSTLCCRVQYIQCNA